MGKKKKKHKKAEAEAPPVVEPRARISQAERKQRNLALRWNPEYNDRSWMKHARCGLCRKLFCVNNNTDRQVRIPKVRNTIVCGFCHRTDTEVEYLVRCHEIIQQMTAKDPPKWVQRHNEAKNGSYTGMGK